MTNLNTAFDVAEKYLDIPKMLDAEGEQAGRRILKKKKMDNGRQTCTLSQTFTAQRNLCQQGDSHARFLQQLARCSEVGK